MSSISPEEDWFYRALEIADPKARADFLAQHCEAGLRAAVEAMLADHAEAEALLENCAAGMTWSRDLADKAVRSVAGDIAIGATLGRYKVVKYLGEGGIAVVYEAEQETPVRRVVALKVLKPQMDTQRIIARFEAERQTLALMEHPNIAHVIDAGATDSGRPYFVMERVQGVRITEYCLQAGLDAGGRLRLMLDVCAAIQHAHQRGVIHLDIKPSNILVSVVDERPLVKVIDFGIAKVMADAPSESAADLFAGTPAYMSPEQLHGLGGSDTRADIFSLGVVAFELLEGHPPKRNERGRVEDGAVGIKRSGDLQWVLRKALAATPDQRYETVRGLAQDLEGILEGRPVSAHPAGALYRFRKLVMRNRVAASACAVAGLALVGGFLATTRQLIRAREAERQEARLRVEAEEREHVTKAAILLMLGKTAEADAEVERMGGVLTQPSVEATRVFRDLSVWSALRGDWRTTSRRLLALTRVNQFDDTDLSDNASRDFIPIAPTLVACGDLETYREFHRQLLDRVGRTQNPIAAEQVLKCSLQVPEDATLVPALKPLAVVAERSLVGKKGAPGDWLEAWRCTALALWNYRGGNLPEALRWSELSLSLNDDEEARHAFTRIVHALTLCRLGRKGEAKADLEAARRPIEDTFRRGIEFHRQGYWHDWLAAKLLLAEADAAVARK